MDTSRQFKDAEHVSANGTTVIEQETAGSQNDGKKPVPLNMKILSVIIVSMIGFGGHWSSGVTGALKSTLKKATYLQYPAILKLANEFLYLGASHH